MKRTIMARRGEELARKVPNANEQVSKSNKDSRRVDAASQVAIDVDSDQTPVYIDDSEGPEEVSAVFDEGYAHAITDEVELETEPDSEAELRELGRQVLEAAFGRQDGPQPPSTLQERAKAGGWMVSPSPRSTTKQVLPPSTALTRGFEQKKPVETLNMEELQIILHWSEYLEKKPEMTEEVAEQLFKDILQKGTWSVIQKDTARSGKRLAIQVGYRSEDHVFASVEYIIDENVSVVDERGVQQEERRYINRLIATLKEQGGDKAVAGISNTALALFS